MKSWSVLVVPLLLVGCASAPAPENTSNLFRDSLFAAPSVRISADDVFALSPAMKQYLRADMAEVLSTKGEQRGLVDALYNRNQLKLVYDAELTRNAAQTFNARAGNCLSLVIMTAAFAKELGVPVQYQSVLMGDFWSRAGDMYIASSHVNMMLGDPQFGKKVVDERTQPLTIDFLPQEDLHGQRLRIIDEHTIVAMYMNNRAAESLAEGKVDDAYWWARAAIQQDPKFLSGYNTLGVVYLQHGNLQQADQLLSHVLAIEPDNTLVMSNLVRVYNNEGRVEDATTLARKLQSLEPDPPFYFFNLGLADMRKGDYRAAKAQFEKELARDAYYHEFHFWLAIADINLDQIKEARSELMLALENSSTSTDHALYAAKLDHIKRYHVDWKVQ
jgi:tetratricopeptide (TPR) repeat protein